MPTKKATPKKQVTEREYLEKSAKLCDFFVDIDNRFIEVPFDEEPDMTAMHLVGSYGFQIQYVIPGSTIKNPNKFVPTPFEHKAGQLKKQIEPEYKPVERFKTREGWYLNLVGIKANKELEFAWLDSMKPNFSMSRLTAEINVKHKVWVFLGKQDGQS